MIYLSLKRFLYTVFIVYCIKNNAILEAKEQILRL